MVDDEPILCECGHECWAPCYDADKDILICRKCVEKIGHEPPYTSKEYRIIGIKNNTTR